MKPEDIAKLKNLKIDNLENDIKQAYQTKNYQIAFEKISNSSKASKNNLKNEYIEICYEASKIFCLNGQIQQARNAAATLETLKPTSKSLKYLNNQRLALLNSRDSVPKSDYEDFHPGIAKTDRAGDVFVLGQYVTNRSSALARRGRRNIRQVVDILKKSPSELDFNEKAARPKLLRILGYKMWQQLSSHNREDIDIIVSIPPDASRYAVRGYSPPDEFAKAISFWSCIPFERNIILKQHGSQPTRNLSREERAIQLKGTLYINEENRFLIENKNILVVDDVVTYGTHLEIATELLLSGGANCTHLATIATSHTNIH